MSIKKVNVELREDILDYIKAKAQKYDMNIDAAVENCIIRGCSALRYDDGNSEEMPPLVSAERLSKNTNDVLNELRYENEIMFIWREGEVQAVLVSENRYRKDNC